jgi:hypothetical protein
MTTPTTTSSPFSTNPDFARGRADAYDDSAKHHPAVVQSHAELVLDLITPASSQAERLYAAGYARAALEAMQSHIEQADKEQTRLARKQGRETSTLHTRHRSTRRSTRTHRSSS